MQVVTVKELAVLNPLTKLRELTLDGDIDDPRLDWLSLGHDVMVRCFGFASTPVPAVMQSCWEDMNEVAWNSLAVCICKICSPSARCTFSAGVRSVSPPAVAPRCS
jgi:hypothetical protein